MSIDPSIAIGAGAMSQALDKTGHELAAGDIVLVRTGRDEFYGQPDYIDRGPGVTAEATTWLYERGVRVMGIDAWGWDRPLRMQAADALQRNAPGVFWEAHQVDLPYSQIEQDFVDLIDDLWGEPERRLVHQDHRRACHQRPSDG